MKKIIIVFLSVFLFISCESDFISFSKIKITTSILPLASISNYIWWSNVEVNSVIWIWDSPHDFELKPSDIINISKSDIVVYTWFSIDNFFDKNITKKQKVITMREKAIKREILGGENHSHDYSKASKTLLNKENEFDETKNYDPHVWLSPLNAKILARDIRDALIEIDPDNKNYYENNYYDFMDEINLILKEFYDFQEDKKQNHFIVLHDWFEYLFYEIWLNKDKQLVIRKTPWVEITIKDFLEIKKIINKEKDKKVWAIFREPEIHSKAIESLDDWYEIPIKTLSPLWEDGSASSYIENLKNNLEALKTIYEQ